MPKYQIVLDSTEVIPDGEFEEMLRPFFDAHPEFTYRFAVNLEGIKKEFWERKEAMAENVNSPYMANKIFNELSDLFKIK